MPSKAAKQRKFDKKKKALEIKNFKKKRAKLTKVVHTKPDGFQYNEYIEKVRPDEE